MTIRKLKHAAKNSNPRTMSFMFSAYLSVNELKGYEYKLVSYDSRLVYLRSPKCVKQLTALLIVIMVRVCALQLKLRAVGGTLRRANPDRDHIRFYA